MVGVKTGAADERGVKRVQGEGESLAWGVRG